MNSRKLLVVETPKDEILNGLNRFSQAKKTGAVGKEEFAGIYGKTLSLIANCFRNGKLSYVDSELLTSLESQLIDEKIEPQNRGLNLANITYDKDKDVSIFERENRFSSSMGLKR